MKKKILISLCGIALAAHAVARDAGPGMVITCIAGTGSVDPIITCTNPANRKSSSIRLSAFQLNYGVCGSIQNACNGAGLKTEGDNSGQYPVAIIYGSGVRLDGLNFPHNKENF